MIPAVLKRSSSKGLKKIRSGRMSSSELLMLPATVPVGLSVQWKNFIQAFAGISLWRKRCSAFLTCQQYFLVHMGIFKILEYTRNIHVIFITYTMYIQLKFSVYTVEIYLICMVYAWYMQCLYTQYTCYILCIYNVYPIEIFCIYSLNLFDVHGICMVYVMHITSIYLLYDNNNLPCPCTLTHLVLAPCTQHQPAWTYGS